MKEYIVNEIKKTKNKILVRIGDETYSLNENSFSEFLLYSGRKLSVSEYLQLKQLSAFGDALEDCIAKLNRHPATELEVYQYLKKKKCEDKNIGQMIRKLKEYHLIDDENFAKEYQEQYSHYLGYGKNKIINELKKKGVNESIIANLLFSEDEEIKNGKVYLMKIEKQLSRLPSLAKKRKAKALLLAHGFDEGTISSLLSSLTQNGREEESDLLEKEYEKTLKSYQRRYEGYELKRHIISHLLYKGYNLDEIKKKTSEILEDE